MTSEPASPLSLNATWTDPLHRVVWNYILRYYPTTKEVELVSNGKLFLKRTRVPEMTPDNLVLGSTVLVCARQLRLIGYADAYTASALQGRVERTLALIKPDGLTYMGEILTAITDAGLMISQLRLCHLSLYEAEQFYAVHRQQPFYPGLTRYMSSAPILSMELLGTDAVSAWRQLLGPTDSGLARQQAPGTIRARFGTDKTYNACHGSDSPTNALTELGFFFGPQGCSNGIQMGKWASAGGACRFGRVQPRFQGTSLCLIKPSVVKEGKAGAIICALQQHGLVITAAQSCTFDRQQALRFLEVYEGVVPQADFEGMVAELSTGGPCVALEVAMPDGLDGSAVELLRAVCGPLDPEMARAVRPASLRALFGGCAARNGLHCTDLEGDTQLELICCFGC